MQALPTSYHIERSHNEEQLVFADASVQFVAQDNNNVALANTSLCTDVEQPCIRSAQRPVRPLIADGIDGTTLPVEDQDGSVHHDQNNYINNNDNAFCMTSRIRVIQLCVFLVFGTIAVGASLALFYYLQRQEQDEFLNAFDTLATKLVEGFRANALLRVQVLDDFSISITSTANAMSATFPFVTIPDFEARATAARALCKSDFLELYPPVTPENRAAWERYTQDPAHLKWLNESYAFQKQFQRNHKRTVGPRAQDLLAMQEDHAPQENDNNNRDRMRNLIELEISDFDSNVADGNVTVTSRDDTAMNADIAVNQSSGYPINASFNGTDGTSPHLIRYSTADEQAEGYSLYVIEDGPGPFYPMWQQSPARANANIDINYNVYDVHWPTPWSEAFEVVRLNQTAVFGAVWNVDATGNVDENDDYDYRVVPAGTLFYPVFETVNDRSSNNNTVVSIIGLDMEFGPLFSSVLLPDSKAIVCVISNPCGQTFSYQVNGVSSFYMGPDDLHDHKFDTVVKVTDFVDQLSSSGEGAFNGYVGAPINHKLCPWTLHIYASEELESQYITKQPGAYMAVILSLFIVTCLIFILYDYVYEK